MENTYAAGGDYVVWCTFLNKTMDEPRRESRGGPDREWFQMEKKRLEDEIREEMQEAVSNVHILNQNMEHLNDVGQEVVAISSVWVEFLRQMTASNEKTR